jgi:hypothetical protein
MQDAGCKMQRDENAKNAKRRSHLAFERLGDMQFARVRVGEIILRF